VFVIIVGQNWVKKIMVNKYTFEVSYHKTIMADTLDSALVVLKDKLKPINECKKTELIRVKEC
jgi:hypothetical protein